MGTRILTENVDCNAAIPLGMTMLKKQEGVRKQLNLPVLQRRYTQGGFSIFLRAAEYDSLLHISGVAAVAYDLIFLERLGNKQVAVYGYDLKKLSIERITALDVSALSGLDTTDLLDNNINFGLRSEPTRSVALFASDTRRTAWGEAQQGYYKGIIGEGKIQGKRLKKRTWTWGDIPDVPEMVYPNDVSQNYPLWSSPFPPHVSTKKHVTKSGFEMCYATEWWEDIGGVGNTIRARWFIRNLTSQTPWQLLFDLSLPQQYYVEIAEGTAELQFPPHNWDTRWYTCVTDSTIYMRVQKYGTYTIPTLSATAVHEWWTLWRDYNVETKTWGEWELFYDGFWGAYREDTSRWVFQGTIYDPLERMTGYVEKKEHSTEPDMYYNLFRFWFVLNGNPMTMPIGFVDIDIEQEFGIINGQDRGASTMECWAMEGGDAYGFLLTTNADNHPEPVRDALLKRVDGILTTVYSPDATRKLGADSGRVISRNGRYYLGQESNRINSTGSTNDLILVDMQTGKKLVINRTPAYKQFYGRSIVWPFSFVEPMRKL